MPKTVVILVENLSVPFDRRVWQECRVLRDDGWDVIVISPKGMSTDRQDSEIVDGIVILRYPVREAGRGRLGYVSEYAGALWHTRRLLRTVEFIDVIQACNPPDLFFLLIGRMRRRGAKFVFDQHDLVPELYLARFGRGRDWVYHLTEWLERRTYRVADLVISPNDSFRHIAIDRGGKPESDVYVVRSAPDLDRFHLVAPHSALKRGHRYLLCYLGIMGPQDGVDHALLALNELHRLRPADWHATFLGDGSSYASLRQLAADLGLGDRVDFPGRVQGDALRQYLSTADVCMAPEPKNPLNDLSTMNKVLEYMALGRPIVAFDLKETRFSAGQAAVYAPPDDHLAFATLVSELLDDADRRTRMGEVGRARVAGPLSWAFSADALKAAYRRVEPG